MAAPLVACITSCGFPAGHAAASKPLWPRCREAPRHGMVQPSGSDEPRQPRCDTLCRTRMAGGELQWLERPGQARVPQRQRGLSLYTLPPEVLWVDFTVCGELGGGLSLIRGFFPDEGFFQCGRGVKSLPWSIFRWCFGAGSIVGVPPLSSRSAPLLQPPPPPALGGLTPISAGCCASGGTKHKRNN